MHRAMRRAATLLLVAVATGRAQQLSAGQLVADTVHAKSLERNLYGDSPDRSMLVYLPQSYASSPNRRYPVVYLLHGYGGDERGWTGYAPLKPAMDTLVRAGIVREMIIVMPNGNNALGGSFYTNSTTTGNWDDFIAQRSRRVHRQEVPHDRAAREPRPGRSLDGRVRNVRRWNAPRRRRLWCTVRAQRLLHSGQQ